MLRQGSGEPLVLLHGILCGERIWGRVPPLLAGSHDVILPPLARSGRVRRWALRYSAVHGERVSPAELLAMADDTIGCEIAGDLLAGDGQLAPLDPPPCPITLAWSGRDRIFPVDVNGARARELIPGARFIVLNGVGHVPMLDDPQLVAHTILAATTAGSAAALPSAAPHSSELHSQGDT